MSALEDYIAAKLDAAFDEVIQARTCVRDGLLAIGGFDGDPLWCPMCGMHPKAEGPAKPIRLVGITGLRL